MIPGTIRCRTEKCLRHSGASPALEHRISCGFRPPEKGGRHRCRCFESHPTHAAPRWRTRGALPLRAPQGDDHVGLVCCEWGVNMSGWCGANGGSPTSHPQSMVPSRRQDVVSSHRPASPPQHAWAGRGRGEFPSMGRTMQGTPLSSKLLAGGRFNSRHGSRCGASPEHKGRRATHVHVISAFHGHIRPRLIVLGNAAPPDKGPLALRGVGPVVLPMVRKALEVPRRRGHVVDVPAHCVPRTTPRFRTRPPFAPHPTAALAPLSPTGSGSMVFSSGCRVIPWGNGNVGKRKLVKPWRKPRATQRRAECSPILICAPCCLACCSALVVVVCWQSGIDAQVIFRVLESKEPYEEGFR